MNPVPLFLIIVSIDVKNVEEKVLEVKEEVKPEESIVETNSGKN